MKIAVATRDDYREIAGHAGRATDWLVFDLGADADALEPRRLRLTPQQLPHVCGDDPDHPLRGVDVLIAASAGDGFLRHMSAWGAQVLLTGDLVPLDAVRKLVAGEALEKTRFDVTTTLCKLRDLFSAY